MLKRTTLIACASILMLSSFSGDIAYAAGAGKKLALGKPFKHEAGDFQIKPPKGWLVTDQLAETQQILFIDPNDDLEKGPVGGSIIIAIGPTKNDFKKELQAFRDGLPQDLPGFTFIIDKKFKLKKYQAHLFGGRWTQSEVPVENRALMVKKGELLYTVIATSSQDDWNRYEKIFTKVLKSFKPEI